MGHDIPPMSFGGSLRQSSMTRQSIIYLLVHSLRETKPADFHLERPDRRLPYHILDVVVRAPERNADWILGHKNRADIRPVGHEDLHARSCGDVISPLGVDRRTIGAGIETIQIRRA